MRPDKVTLPMLACPRIAIWAAALLGVATPAVAQLRLDITEGVKDAVPVAIVPFGGQPEGAATDIASVVAGDLRLSGRFAPLDRKDMVTRPTSGTEIRFEDWRLLRADYTEGQPVVSR